MLRGVVYETIKIYSEKFTTNNSENNYKLSYTPKPLPQPTARLSSRTSPLQFWTAKLFKEIRTPSRKNSNNKKSPTSKKTLGRETYEKENRKQTNLHHIQ